jgi:glyoxylase-like metal-dependent hydrolase (beta-lactamase superfamily II)
MKVVTLTTGQFAENCFLVIDEGEGVAAVVDPGEDAKLILARLATEGARVTEIWITHAHVDHILGVADVHDKTGAPIRLHPDDLPLYHAAPPPLPEVTLPFTPGESVSVGSLRFAVRHTPGHSPGSVSLLGHGIALVGDVLFAGSVGRVDLPGGDGAALLHSIESELLTLPDDTIVYSGHGPTTSVGAERRTNPFLTGAARLA